MKRFFFILFFMPIFLMAQDEAPVEVPPSDYGQEYQQPVRRISDQEAYESTAPEGVKVDEESIKADAEKLNFDELVEPPKQEKKSEKSTSENRQNRQQFPKERAEKKVTTSTGNGVFVVVFIILAVVLVGLLFLLSKNNAIVTQAQLDYSITDVIDANRLRNLKPTQEFEAAMAKGEYRQAIRVLFLNNLRLCMEKGWIEPAAQKTNMDYVRELSGKEIQGDAQKTTSIFEYVWYGNAPLNNVIFAEYRTQFDQLFHRIQSMK